MYLTLKANAKMFGIMSPLPPSPPPRKNLLFVYSHTICGGGGNKVTRITFTTFCLSFLRQFYLGLVRLCFYFLSLTDTWIGAGLLVASWLDY